MKSSRKVPFIEAIDRVRGRDIVYGDTIVSVGSGEFEVPRDTETCR